MKVYRVREGNLRRLVDDLVSKGYIVIAPTIEEPQGTVMTEVTTGRDVTLDAGIVYPSPRYFLQPNEEPLFTCEGPTPYEIERVTPVIDERKNAFFCIHPCDCNAIAVLDSVHSTEPRDVHYLERRRRALIIVLSCAEKPSDKCFCDVLACDKPWYGTYDLWIVPREGEYLVKVGSARGREVIDGIEKEVIEETIVESTGPNPKAAEELVRILDQKYGADVWSKFAEKCMICGSCLAVCPTCHCFEIEDRVLSLVPFKCTRVRKWDPCIFRYFTMVAGGRVARADPTERFKHRYYHKFVFMWRKYGVFGCVGCSRCAIVCPAAISPLDVLSEVVGIEVLKSLRT
ncbi:MAG: hypothetical protein DRJ40_00235 [Thermoprotei archaeon]|nr:MAG: hypothetical protein DRJ40_00235 [Thermoprotei archaeon]